VIRLDDRVSSVLAREPALLEVFLQTSPSFAMLKNPMARKTMAKLVTIEQAARVAGVEAQVLLARLNAALGEGPAEPPPAVAEAKAPEPPPAAPPPPGLLATPAERIADLDVREDLRAGKEPLRQILEAVRALPEGHVFRLRAIFEPAPLYDVLAKQGFGHFTERFEKDDWRVWFFRDPNARASVAKPKAAAPAEDDGMIVLDVRELEPPEPMQRTLEALSKLEPGQTLVQINARVPQFLLPKLEERGFSYEIREQSDELVRIFICHTNR